MDHLGLRTGWFSLLLVTAAAVPTARAQQPPPTTMPLPGTPPAIVHRVQAANERLQMTVNTSRIVTLGQKIPQAQVNNPDILELHALSPTEVQVSAKKSGVTQVNLWGEDQKIYTLDVVVYGDAQELNMIIRQEFPNSTVRAIPLANAVLLTGYVDQPEQISRIVQIAEEFYPKVLNNMTVGGVQLVLLHVKVMEVSRTKLRALGFDFAKITNGNLVASVVSGLITSASGTGVTTSGDQTFLFSVFSNGNAFFGVLEALRQDNCMKILADPTIVTQSGRAAFFQVGGEFPILVPQSMGTVSIEYKKFGTQVDFVPIVLGNGRIHLDVRPRVSEIDNTRSVTIQSTTVPGLRVREVETGVEMMAGQTLAIAGLVQSREEAENKGLPLVSEVPYLGALFRRVQHQYNEIELLVLVTPELAEPLDPQTLPCGPGMRTRRPDDCDLYLKGHLEVPNCCPACQGTGCPECRPQAQGPQGEPGMILDAPEAVPGPKTSGTTPAPAKSKQGITIDRVSTGGGVSIPVRAVRPSSRQDRQNPADADPPLPPNPPAGPPPFVGPVGFDDK